MDEVCTLNDLVAYLYNETQLTQTVVVQHSIDHVEEVAETYSDLLAAKALLDNTLLMPSSRALRNVFSYSLEH